MRIIAKRSLASFVERHPAARQAVLSWCDEVAELNWAGPREIRARYVSASAVGRNRVVFNLKGDGYRLIVAVAYRVGVVHVKFIGTQADYDRIDATTVELE